MRNLSRIRSKTHQRIPAAVSTQRLRTFDQLVTDLNMLRTDLLAAAALDALGSFLQAMSQILGEGSEPERPNTAAVVACSRMG